MDSRAPAPAPTGRPRRRRLPYLPAVPVALAPGQSDGVPEWLPDLPAQAGTVGGIPAPAAALRRAAPRPSSVLDALLADSPLLGLTTDAELLAALPLPPRREVQHG